MTFEAARSFDQVGMHEDALAIKCTSKYAAAAPSCIRLLQGPTAPKAAELKMSVGMLVETVDPITGFKSTIDTRESYAHPTRAW